MSKTEASLFTKIPLTPGPGYNPILIKLFDLHYRLILKGSKMTKASRSSEGSTHFLVLDRIICHQLLLRPLLTLGATYSNWEYGKNSSDSSPTPSAASYHIKSPTPSGGRLPAAKRSF